MIIMVSEEVSLEFGSWEERKRQEKEGDRTLL